MNIDDINKDKTGNFSKKLSDYEQSVLELLQKIADNTAK